MSEHTLAILVKAVGASKAAKDLKGVDAAVSNIGAKAGKGLRKVGDNLGRIGVIGAGLAAAGIVASVKAAADFESQLNTINTVAGLTAGQLEEVGGGIRKLARDTGSELSDLSGAYYDLVSAGIKPGADALKILTLANTLAIGGLATTGEAVDLLTTAVNTYHLNANQAAQATDQFAEAIALGKVTAAELAGSFAQVGPIAQSMGVGINEIAAGYATLTAKGIPASEAATNMRAALVALAKPTASLNTAQTKLGVNFAKIAREKGLQVAMQKIVSYSKKTGVPLAKLLGRIEGVQYALSTTDKNADDYNDALTKVNSATGTAADQMSERQKGLNYELSRLKALAIDAGISLGSKLLPKLTPLVEKAVAFLDTHQSDIDKFGDGIAGAFDKALAFAEKIPWGAIGAGLQMAADWAGRLMSAFTTMPPEAQATIIALAGLNKLSGGAISGIVGELGKGLIKGVLGMTAGVVNIKAGVVNGGGGGLPGGGAAGAAGAAGAGIAPALAPMGLAAVIGTALTGGVIGMFAVNISKGITDAISGPLHDLTGASTSAIDAAAEQSRRQAFGAFEALRDLPGTIDRMGGAIGALQTFIGEPHPDFLGDLGQLLLNPVKPPAPKPDYMPTGGPTGFSDANIKAIEAAKAAQVAAIRETGSTTGVDIRDTTAQVVTAQDAITSATETGSRNVQVTTATGTGATTSAVNASAAMIAGAIGRINFAPPTVNVTVGPGSITKQTVIQNRVGPPGGSLSRPNNNTHGQ